MSFRYQASNVAGFATAVNSSKAFRPSRWAISANVVFPVSDNNNLPLIWALSIRFSAARYSFLSKSSWSTVPVMYASARAQIIPGASLNWIVDFRLYLLFEVQKKSSAKKL